MLFAQEITFIVHSVERSMRDLNVHICPSAAFSCSRVRDSAVQFAKAKIMMEDVLFSVSCVRDMRARMEGQWNIWMMLAFSLHIIPITDAFSMQVTGMGLLPLVDEIVVR